jgi:uncharacterized membrane protein YfcA
MPGALDVALAIVVVAAGSCLQGAVGFGVNLVASPLLLLLDDVFVPVPVIVASILLNLLVRRREGHASVDHRVDVAIWGQVAGAVAASAAVSALPDEELSLVFAGTVLLAVALSASGLHVAPSRPVLVGAGTASGFMGTISGIGGPPMALVYQRVDGPTLRATLARFFLVGGFISVAALAVAGAVGTDELVAAAVLLPGVVLGFRASAPLVRRLDQRSVRPVVLVLSAAAAVAVLVRELA